jgi:signal transduction histidine kinase
VHTDRSHRLALIALVVAAGIFVLDVSLPLGASVPGLYVLVVLLGLFVPGRRFALSAAMGTSLLTVAGATLSEHGPVPWMAALNRPLALLAIWATGLVVERYKAAEKRLVAERTLLGRVLASAPIVLWSTDPSGRVTLAEGSEAASVGLVPGARRGLSVLEWSRDLPWLADLLRRAGSGEEVVGSGDIDGRFYEVHCSPVRDDEGRVQGTIGVALDISKRMKAEAALRRQESLARLGEMAAALAHEVRNPLAGIKGTVQVIAGRLAPDSPDRPALGGVLARIGALDELTENLLLFSRPPAPRRTLLQLQPLLTDAVEPLRGDQKLSSIAVEIDAEDVTLRADPGLLRGALVNLLLNAAQAMGGRGVIRVSVRVVEGRCHIAIRDSGPGIPEELRARVFEPFFTTKHRGSGLGLAIVRQSVEAHGGEITLTCPAGGGTVVSLDLPLEAPPSVAARD